MNLEPLDKVFSIYIRRRYADDNGLVRCCTCGHPSPWMYMDNGHFISRGKLATRYDERNCHCQCVYCKRIKSGNLIKYKAFLIATYGPDIIDELVMKSHETVKWMPHQVREMIAEFKSKTIQIDSKES